MTHEDELTLKEIRERHDGYFVPTDLDTPTCSACLGDVSVRDGHDWTDGDLCDRCAGLATSVQHGDVGTLLRLLDEARATTVEAPTWKAGEVNTVANPATHCTCHERDGSFSCPYCKTQGIYGHCESKPEPTEDSQNGT